MQRRSLFWARQHVARRCIRAVQHPSRRPAHFPLRSFHSCSSRLEDQHAPLRKQLKDAAKAAKRSSDPSSPARTGHDVSDIWELTVGIEIHAQLNASRKLFSIAPVVTLDAEPNCQVAPFDISLPGSLPVLQDAVLLPALRAATVLGCTIQPVSHFDRKHYFYHDQPAGYQITQYYHPFAKNGCVVLSEEDGLPAGRSVNVRIKQVQLEQDTARTQKMNAYTSLIDFNRSGQALIEIISLPDLHSPEEAAAYVRKVHSLLYAVDAVTAGMEQGGLRADVNVSVRRRDAGEGGLSYSGVGGLGQRTEIKNLSTFKGIADAIEAERNRQIEVLEMGGVIEAETRRYSITRPGETLLLRSKEGEVDYRYMPDADIPPLEFDESLIRWVKDTLPPTSIDLSVRLVTQYGVSAMDARTLVSLADGERLIYFQQVVDGLMAKNDRNTTPLDHGRVVSVWVLYELGALLAADDKGPALETLVSPDTLADIIHRVEEQEITRQSAKLILKYVYDGDTRGVATIIKDEGLNFTQMSTQDYEALAAEVISGHPEIVGALGGKGGRGKIKFLLGKMMNNPRRSEMNALEAEKVLCQLLFPDPGTK